MFETPILYIIFNRIDTVQQTFPVIKKQKPKHLYVAADGPRIEKSGEAEKCNQVRNWVLSQIDWDCEVKTLFREDNLGCGKGPASAISWFFENVEQGIILEDDCLPTDSFFSFCENLLEKYKDDERIMQISGTNRLGLIKESTSYFFTNYPSEWGWATWKRAWDKYDYSIKQWGTKEAKDIVADMYGKYSIFLAKIFDDTFNNVDSITWWDYQWGFIKNINSGLTITPYLNQISNIGFDENATHTTDTSSKFNRLPTQELPKELIHPNYVYKTVTYDNLILDLHFKSQLDSLKPKSFTFRLKRKIKSILRKIGLWKK